ncbi:hypothetical protein EDB85DRAFT_533157 [Lactarius pseudohatsudake]|nr:hypothetical protein EDB85DRAFT_533157 [Lactarius pseudohatsudake]
MKLLPRTTARKPFSNFEDPGLARRQLSQARSRREWWARFRPAHGELVHWGPRSRIVAHPLLSAPVPASPCLPNQPPVTRISTRRRPRGLGRGEPPPATALTRVDLNRAPCGLCRAQRPASRNGIHAGTRNTLTTGTAATPISLRWRWRVEMRVSLSGGFPNRLCGVPARAPRRRGQTEEGSNAHAHIRAEEVSLDKHCAENAFGFLDQLTVCFSEGGDGAGQLGRICFRVLTSVAAVPACIVFVLPPARAVL